MTLLPLHRPRFGQARNIPDFPDHVRGPVLITEGAELHRLDGCTQGGDRSFDTAAVLGRGVTWCTHCWPGHRCGICTFPSGPDSMCRRCTGFQATRERRLDNVA